MFQFFTKYHTADIFCDSFEKGPIHRAVDDLKNDVKKVGGREPTVKKYLPVEENGVLVIGTLENERFRDFLKTQKIDVSGVEGKWEHYLIATFGTRHENLLICGSDIRGTMWGIYEVCDSCLGVDPLYFWTDHEPLPQEELAIHPCKRLAGPKTYKFRGWFVNDEDLFTEWKENGGKRYIDYPFYWQVTHQSIIEKVVETALRLKQNLLIPASFVDIENPAEENLIRIVTERGLFISQHHVEPMGVSHFGWDRFWRKRGQHMPASYVVHPDKFEEIWAHYAEKWAKYENVIWQLGLRGRGDRPVWFHDSHVSPSMEDRGALISSAIAKQKEIVEKVLGHKNFPCTSTLWMEGSELHNDGFLTFPRDTMVIFADNGPSQMLTEDFYHVKRHTGTDYGIYYHVAFWSDGPHLIQGTSLDKMYFNYKNAVEKGDTAYSILNVTNIREVALGIRAVADMTWDFTAFDRNLFLEKWCGRQFGDNCKEKVKEVYDKLYKAFYRLDDRRIPDHMVLLDGMVRHLGLSLIKMDRDFSAEPELKLENKLYHFKNYEELAGFYKNATAESLDRWKEAYAAAHGVLPFIEPSRKQYFVDNIIVQIEMAIGLYSWLHHLAAAAEARGKNDDRYGRHVTEAVFALEKLLMDRKKAEHGKWADWYRGDKKMNLPQVLDKTRELLKQP